jgi:outer membrane usher protein
MIMRRGALIILIVLFAAYRADAQPLLLEIWINGRNTHVVARVVEHDGKFEVSNVDLADAGLAVARGGSQSLDARTDIRAEEDSEDQRLLLTLDPSRLSRTVVDLRSSLTEDVTPAGRGATLRYDISAAANDLAHPRNTSSIGGALGLTLFQGNARFTATGFATAGLGARSARLDTALEFDTPSAPRRLIFGDAITGVPQWARSVRFGGVEIATDFSQQPGKVTFPLPEFFGLAAVPSTVDVFVGASRVFSGAVSEGPFALNDLPVMTGGGSATVVTRDVLGRQISQTISLYTDPVLLANGLSGYSLDAGFLRRNYGVSSADYAAPFASALWRRGFGDITAEMHGALAGSLALVSAGGAAAIGNVGLRSVDAAASRHDGHKGGMASVNVAARAGAISVFGVIAAATGRFADLASLSGDTFPSLRYQSGISAGFGHDGSLSLSWIGERAHGERRSDLLTASYALSFGNGLFFGLTGFRSFSDRSWAGQMFISLPLGDASASASVSAGTGKSSFEGMYDKPLDPDGGFGYRLLAGTRFSQRAEADADWIADHGELDGSAALANGHAALRLGASGGLVFLDDRLYATRVPDGAVALVETGAPGIRIYRENRMVAHSDAQGDALLTGLNPYTANRIGVDPRDYPIDVDVGVSSRVVAPPRGAGVVVNLAPAVRHSFVAVIRRENGDFPPVGALVDLHNGSPSLIVGRSGEVFLGGITHPVDSTVEMGIGTCHARIVPPPHASTPVMRAGPFVCRGAASHEL